MQLQGIDNMREKLIKMLIFLGYGGINLGDSGVYKMISFINDSTRQTPSSKVFLLNYISFLIGTDSLMFIQTYFTCAICINKCIISLEVLPDLL